MFVREWLFEYKTDFFDWEQIQTVSHKQNSFWDKLFSRGDLIITLDHGVEYPFEDITAPQKQAERILKYKMQFSPNISADASASLNNEKMSIIAEALSEVVKEYMDKKTSEEEDEEDY